MIAVVEISGKQYVVRPGESVVVDRVDGEVGSKIDFDKVLLIEKEGKVVLGKPYIKSAKVEAKVISQDKGEKITVRRYKSKVRYRKTKGFRARETKLEITKIS